MHKSSPFTCYPSFSPPFSVFSKHQWICGSWPGLNSVPRKWMIAWFHSKGTTVVPCNKVHAVFREISIPYAVVYLMLWYTFANPFRGPQYPQNCKNGPKKPQSLRKCTFYNIIRYFIGHYSLYYHSTSFVRVIWGWDCVSESTTKKISDEEF